MKLIKKEFILVVIFFIFYILIRSVHFTEFLNFSFDQGWSATKALEIWRNKEITLVGPGSSLVVHGKQVLFGSIDHYISIPFLLFANFDPVVSSYLYMLFTALMIFPLYYGVKYFIDKKASFLIISVYSFLPLFIDFTRFFSPGLQFSLMAIMILFMGLFKKFKKSRYLFLVFLTAGVLSQMHYAFFMVNILLVIYYFITIKKRKKLLILASIGFIIGFSPIIVFELKNQFYNTKVLIEYFRFARSGKNFAFLPHRELTLTLFVFILLVGIFKKNVHKWLIFLVTVVLFIIDLLLYLPLPSHAYGMSPHWNFLMEKKAYEIIKSQKNIKNYNIVNHIYDNKAVVVKFQMKRDGIKINFDDYYHEDYLYVISPTDNVFNDPAYELNTFKPNKKMGEWRLNDYYNLYLFKRIQK